MARLFLFLLFIPLIVGCNSFVQISSEELIEKMISAYSEADSLRESSICKTNDLKKNVSSTISTKVSFKRPNLIRIETEGQNNSALILSDGSDLFVNFNNSEEVNSRTAPETVSALYSRLSASSSYPVDSIVNEFFLLDGRFPSKYVKSSKVESGYRRYSGVPCYVLNLEFTTGVKQTLLIDSKRYVILSSTIEVFSSEGEKLTSSEENMGSVLLNEQSGGDEFVFDKTGKKVLQLKDLEKKAASYSPLKGKKAPDFQASTSKGKTVSLASYKGKTLVLFFWDSLYKPSFDGIGLLSEIKKDFGDELAVAALANEPDVEDREAVFKSYGADFDNLYDKDGAVSEVYEVQLYPHMTVISPDGKILEESSGVKNREEISAIIKRNMRDMK